MFRRISLWCLGRIPTLVVWAGLAGLFAYGAINGWKFGDDKKEEKAKEEAVEQTESFSASIQEQPYDVPIEVTHDPKECKIGERPVALKSASAAKLAGIRCEKASSRTVSIEIEAHGEVLQDPTAIAKVSPLVGGIFLAVDKQVGDPVRRGELIALVESTDVGKAKAGYLSAKAALESREAERELLNASSPTASIVKADAAVREARAALYTARQVLDNLGLPLPAESKEAVSDEMLIQRLALLGLPYFKRAEMLVLCRAEGRPLPANLLPLFSPKDGFVLKRAGVVGETVAALQQVYEVGDPTRIYVYLDVRQEDMPRMKRGQNMSFRLEGGANLPPATGTVDWISPMVDEKTRTVRVRATVANSDGMLKSGSFGAGAITVSPAKQALMVPREAVQWEGCTFMVFIMKKDGGEPAYWPRKVTLGLRDDRGVEIVAGLTAGEEVVVTGSHVLKCEMLKARIGEAEE